MKFSIGDIVLLKRTGEEGRVAGFVNNEMVEVEINGTHFPVFLDEVDHPYLKWFTEKKKNKIPVAKTLDDFPQEKKQQVKQQQVASGFHLSFLPVFRFDEFEDIVDKLKTYFINQTPYQLDLVYECSGSFGSIFSHRTVLQPFSHFYLHDIPFEEMHDQPRFTWAIAQKDDKNKAANLKDTLRIKPKKLFDYISNIQQKNEPMFYVRLADDFPLPSAVTDSKQEESKDTIAAVVKALKTPKKEKVRLEIDLHIDQLVDDIKGLSNFEMLSIQLNTFEDALEEAIRLHQQSLVVIHGVGKGKLKTEIHTLLKSTPEVDFFLHDWNPRYGYGATEIFFKQ